MILAALMLAWVSARAFAQTTEQQQQEQSASRAHAAQVDAAEKAASEWLALVDAGKYEASWKSAAPFLQRHLTAKDWEKRLDTVRKPIDPMVERTLHTTQYRDKFPGLPAGEYVAFVWETYFGAKRQMLESVIMSYDGEQWKTIGYAVQ